MKWPFENDTNNIVKKVSIRNIKSGKMKTVLILLTISLSISLITGISLYISSIDVANNRNLDTLQQVFFYDITKNQADNLKKDKRISEIKLTKYGNKSEVQNYIIWPMYIENSIGKIKSVDIFKGIYPKKENEVAIDTSFLKRNNKDLKIGDKISFTFYDGKTESFIISGITNTGSTSDVYPIYFSKEYAQNGSQLKNSLFVAAAQIKDANNMTPDEFIDTINDIGVCNNIDKPNIGPNNAFVQSLTFNPQNLVITIFINLLILFASIIVIYSIFYISIINRIKSFGQLITIGTTSKQIKKIVRYEASILFSISAPFGLFIGSIFAYSLNPSGWSWIKFLILGTIIVLVEYIAVLYSINKPAKIASNISPIEASKSILNSNNISLSKCKFNKINPFSLAIINTKRNRKQFLIASFSLAISGIIFMIGSTFISSFNQEDYARNGILEKGEVRIYLSENAALVNKLGYSGVQINNPLNDNFINQLSKVDGVKNIIPFKKLYCSFEYKNRIDNDFIVPCTKNDFNYLLKYINNSNINYNSLVKNRQIFVLKNSAVEEIYGWKFKTGDRIKFKWFDGEKYQEDIFSIAGKIKNEKAYNDSDCFETLAASGWFIVPYEVIDSMISANYNINSELLISTEWHKNSKQIIKELNKIVSNYDNIQIRTLQDSINSKAGVYNILLTSILGISIFIMMFSLINLINTLVTNITIRKKQISILQSIGMTKKQLKKMLLYESSIISFLNIIVTTIIGGFLGFILIKLLNNIGMDYLHWAYPLILYFIYLIIIIILPITITIISIFVFQKKSLVDRLHEID